MDGDNVELTEAQENKLYDQLAGYHQKVLGGGTGKSADNEREVAKKRIEKIRGTLSEADGEELSLEDEVAGLNIRLEKLVSNLEVIDNDITSKKNLIEESKSLINTTPINAIRKKNHCKGRIFSFRKITANIAANKGAT